MKISAKTDYACRAVLALAGHWPKATPLSIQEISKAQQIPLKFLTHILIQLKHLGLVRSTRGKKGGYTLKKSPEEITLLHIIQGFSDHSLIPADNNPVYKQDVWKSVWQELDKVLVESLAAVNFHLLLQRRYNIDAVAMYEI